MLSNEELAAQLAAIRAELAGLKSALAVAGFAVPEPAVPLPAPPQVGA